jgi:hypothetical protein
MDLSILLSEAKICCVGRSNMMQLLPAEVGTKHTLALRLAWSRVRLWSFQGAAVLYIVRGIAAAESKCCDTA